MMRQLKIGRSITERTSDSLNAYLSEISREEMISPDEEVELAQRIKQGDQKAMARLVQANLRFVVSVAKQYQSSGLELCDLVSEGNIGLIKAAEKFDETKGFKFISYAVWWIRQAILMALAEKGNIIRLPLNQTAALSKINRTFAQFEQENGRKPSVQEVAETTGMDEDQVSRAISSSSHKVSMDAPLNEGTDDRSMLETLSADTPDADDKVMRESLNIELERALKKVLNDKEAAILRQCYGIGTPERSLEEIGLEFSLTRERVRQIKEKSLRKLHDSNGCSILRAFL